MKILIAEDEFIGRTLLTEMLSPFGTCHAVTNGQEACDAVASCNVDDLFDLICLDIMMPEMDGQEALKKIRFFEKEAGFTEDKKAKIIMTTAVDDSENIMEAFIKGGCDGYLIKPIQRNILVEKIKDLGLI